MPTATIQYRSYVFSTTGRPQYGRRVRYEPEVPNTPATHSTVTYTVQQVFTEDSFADNQARYQALRTALQDAEGALIIIDENGNQLVNQVVRVEDLDLPLQWSQNVAEVTVSFTCSENLAGGSSVNATYTPSGGGAISLPKVIAWKESIRTERYGTVIDNRKESNGSVAASGRVRADPTLNSDARRAYLQGLEGTIKAASLSKDGHLVYGTFDQVVRVDALETDLKDGSDYLDWSITCSYRRFPANGDAEADFTVGTHDDLEKMERVTSIRGTIRANDSSTARTKAGAIFGTYGSGKILKDSELSDHWVDGHDGVGWLELSMTAEFRETIGDKGTSYTLTISDKDDLKSGQLMTTYAGKVTGQNSTTCLAKARDLGDAKYTIRLTATETVGSADIAGGDYFTEVTFSYEYLRKGAKIYCEMSSETDKQTFGLDTTTVSGYVTAPTQAESLTRARTFRPTTGLIRSEKETPSTVDAGDGGALHNRLEFSYVSHLVKAAGSIQYQVTTAINYISLETTLSYKGTAWSDTEVNANALITALVASQSAQRSGDERTSSFDQSGISPTFTSRAFTITFSAPVTSGSFGEDGIIQADYSLETTFSVNSTVITPIPYGTPHVQEAVGTTPGVKVASGSITALTEGGGRAWARDKIPSGGYADPYREKSQFIYVKGSSSTVKAVKFDFTYSKRFDVLDFD